MLRNLVGKLFSGTHGKPSGRISVRTDSEIGAVVFVADVAEPVRITPDARLYSDRASVRMRTFVPMRALAAKYPVFVVPVSHVEQSGLAPLQPLKALSVTKFTVNEVRAAPEMFEALIENLERMRGEVRLFADLCDNYAGLDDAGGRRMLARYQEGLAAQCALTVPCAALAEDLGPIARHGVQIIEDPYENPREGTPSMHPGDPVRICWFGSIGAANADSVVQGLKSAFSGLDGRAAQIDFVTHKAHATLANDIGARLRRDHATHTFRHVPWSLDATWRAIDECDFVLLPQEHRTDWGRAKSHNRLVEAIRGGRLAIASPIPSYLELAEYAWVGEDLGAGVRWALAHAADGAARVRAGQEYVATRFSPERIAGRWVSLFA